jgi:hypothetical protein
MIFNHANLLFLFESQLVTILCALVVRSRILSRTEQFCISTSTQSTYTYSRYIYIIVRIVLIVISF